MDSAVLRSAEESTLLAKLKVIEDEAIKPSYELARVRYMGWTFGRPRATREEMGGFRLRVTFTCVCGRQEHFTYIALSLEELHRIDVVRQLVGHGSFSREHLLADGYTEQQIRDIERKGEEFDEVTRQHWETMIQRAGGYNLFRMQRAR